MMEEFEMTPRQKIEAAENEKRAADMKRIMNHPSYIYDSTNYCVAHPKDESK
jgi:hypothetical protein|tara:strand:+ start:2203 stop:2358 length:156 start_codon:yes stop_codon:yes gene_type:complete